MKTAFVHTEPKLVGGPGTFFKNVQKYLNLDTYIYDGLERGITNDEGCYFYGELTNENLVILKDYDRIIISPLHSLMQYKGPTMDHIKYLLEYCVYHKKSIVLIMHLSMDSLSEAEKDEFREIIDGYEDIELWVPAESFAKNFIRNIRDIDWKEYYFTMMPLLEDGFYYVNKTEKSVAIVTRATDNRAYRFIKEIVKNKDYYWRIFISVPEERNMSLHSIHDIPLQDNLEIHFNVSDPKVISNAFYKSEFCLVGSFYDSHYSDGDSNSFDNTVTEALAENCEIVTTKEYDKFVKVNFGKSMLRTYERDATPEEVMEVIRREPYRLEITEWVDDIRKLIKDDKRFNPFNGFNPLYV